jgi:hypothetical protein
MTPDEARRFFVDKIVAQANREAEPLSANERKMLDWSEVEPGCVADPTVAEALANEISDEAYEAKIGRFLAAAYQSDVNANPSAKAAYREAYSVLKRGDYYILVMLDAALGRRLRHWWHFSLS